MSNTKIITVTFNPSLDRTLTIHYLAVGYQNRTTDPSLLYPAGRGVNISRALHALQCETHAVVSLGTEAIGLAYEKLITQEGFPVKILKRPGLTRSNIVILDTGHKTETQLIEESTGATPEHLQVIIDALQEITSVGDIVVYTDDLPNGIPLEQYPWLINAAHEAGATVVYAAGGTSLKMALTAQPDLVVLNQTEIERFFNYPVRTVEDVTYCTQKLLIDGVGRVLVLSAEDDSAILATEKDVWLVDLPDFEPGTSSGVADALIAGYLAGRAMQKPLNKSLEMGAASATYTASQVGNEFGESSDVADIISDVAASSQETD
ncbi:1-phosphofructokinase family hexose kinase [Chloroflexota bacterium]